MYILIPICACRISQQELDSDGEKNAASDDKEGSIQSDEEDVIPAEKENWDLPVGWAKKVENISLKKLKTLIGTVVPSQTVGNKQVKAYCQAYNENRSEPVFPDYADTNNKALLVQVATKLLQHRIVEIRQVVWDDAEWTPECFRSNDY